MNVYDLFMSPLEFFLLGGIRSEIISCAEKNVLEAAIGTGANSRYYDYARIHSIIGLDREYSPELEQRHPKGKFCFTTGNMEQIPFEAERFDTVVATLVLCTVNMEKSLHEIKRVLKPGGKFLFIEHVRPSGIVPGRLFDALNKVWPKIANGCNLNHLTGDAIKQSGFASLDMKYAGNNIFIYGVATKDA